ncbi:MAG: tetratricopeptide repeat protein, partial [Gemmataceae bacterium]
MRRRWTCLVVGIALASCQAGCLSLNTRSTTAQKPKEPAQLPAGDSAQLCLTVADTLATQGHLPEAIDQLRQAQQYDTKADVDLRLARLLARAGRDAEAVAAFERATQAHPKDASLWNDLGYHHYERGRWTAAEAALRQAVTAEAGFTKAWMNLGLTLGQQGRYEESGDAFRKAVRPAEAECNLAFVLATQGKYAEARARYEAALALEPGLEAARTGLKRLEQRPKKDGRERAERKA